MKERQNQAVLPFSWYAQHGRTLTFHVSGSAWVKYELTKQNILPYI